MKPLIKENEERQVKLDTEREKTEKLTKNLRVLYAVIRLPNLVNQFHLLERKRMNEKQIEKANKEAQNLFRHLEVSDNNQVSFIKDLCDSVHSQLSKQRPTSPVKPILTKMFSPSSKV